jgi:hypothetical protein
LQQGGEQSGNFTLTMTPGESRDLTVQLGNLGAETVRARTFPADVYSLVNGGFGARLDGEPTGGTTAWLSYPTETIDLAPAARLERTFTLSVPADAQPGEYQTSLVLQNADPFGDASATSEVSVAFKQIIRQALSVNITVPGPLVPGLQIGTATQQPVGGNTTVVVQVKNTGNVRLKPSGEFVLMDASGKALSRYPITMDTVYAGTETTAEMPFDQLLNPGEYTVSASLADASGVTAAPGPLALIVPRPDAPGGVAEVGPGRATINQAPLAAPAAGPQLPEQGGDASLPIALGTTGLGLALLLGGLVLYRRRRGAI